MWSHGGSQHSGPSAHPRKLSAPFRGFSNANSASVRGPAVPSSRYRAPPSPFLSGCLKCPNQEIRMQISGTPTQTTQQRGSLESEGRPFPSCSELRLQVPGETSLSCCLFGKFTGGEIAPQGGKKGPETSRYSSALALLTERFCYSMSLSPLINNSLARTL